MTKEKTWEDYYDYMIENEIASEEELSMALHFGGCNLETMQEALYYLTGDNSLDDYLEED